MFSHQHFITSHQEVVKGDRANAVNCRLVFIDYPVGSSIQGTSWYEDLLVKTGAGWRISRRANRVFQVRAAGKAIDAGIPCALPLTFTTEAAAGRIDDLEALRADS